jgi:hypothetical protein
LVFPEFADVINGTNTRVSACTIFDLHLPGVTGAIVNNPVENFFSADCTQTTGGCSIGGSVTTTSLCGFVIEGSSGSSGAFTDISVEQAQQCSNLLVGAAANLGIACQ